MESYKILVTGASRGIGKGIAIEFALAGHEVHITGRNSLTLKQVITEFDNLKTGTTGSISYHVCDHSDDAQIESLFNKFTDLDVLINNAYSAVGSLLENCDKKFWEKDISDWDTVNHVGMRSHYLSTVHATRIMLKNRTKPGLICMISSGGGVFDVGFGIPYGAGKAACDRMAIDFANDLREEKIYSFSLWPGAVKTEIMEQGLADENSGMQNWQWKDAMKEGESPRFSGRCLVEVLKRLDDNDFMQKVNGKVVFGSDLSSRFEVVDVDGRKIEKSPIMEMITPIFMSRFVDSKAFAKTSTKKVSL